MEEAILGAWSPNNFSLAKEWFADNGLTLNERKNTGDVIYTLAKLAPEIIQNLQLDVKLLEFTLSPKLTWMRVT